MVALDEQGLIQKNKPSVENIRKWRKTILQLYALSRFQYPICIGTLPIKRFRTCANAIKAVQRFKEAGIKDGTDSLLGDYKITSEELVRLIEERDINALEAFGGVEAIAISLGTCLKNGIDGHHDDIERRKNQFGENNYPRKPPKKFLMFVWNAFQDTTLAILILCAVLSLILGISTKGINRGWYDGTSIGLAVALVVIVTACSDYKQSLQFQTLNEVKRNVNIKVIRGGRTLSLSIYELVVGDVAPLNIGDQVPADGLLIHGHSLSIDESSMTGESEQVFKNRMQPFLLSGCKVVDGFGTMIVTCVGLNTEWGKVMSTLTDDFNEETPLQARLRKVATFIGKIGLSVAIVVFLMLFVRYFRTSYSSKMKATEVLSSVVDILSVAVTIVVVAVPEGLPLAVTLTLAYSMRKMMADKSLVRHLAACETMGSATTICSDKTGTLTMNQMSVVRAWVTGNVKNIEDVKELHRSVLLVIFDCIAQNTTGTVFLPKGNGTPEINGSPTEKAILSWGLQIGMDFEVAKSRSSVVHVETFNSTKKRSGLVLELQEEGKHCIYVHWKGAAEIILDVCTKWLDNEGTERTITEEMNLEIKAIINDMAVCSLRCIALAYRQLGENEAPITEGESNACKFPDFGLTLTTILGLKDPCRPGVLEAVQMCQEAGVKVRMVTGDSLLTAEAIARECGILLPDGLIMEGKRFRHLNEQEMVEMLPRIDVLARSSPTDKLLLVRKLKELNEVVGVTGDGTNDAPALREADVGLSMGISGTEVAKESSDVIILDDNFSSVVKVIRWGRSVYANIQKFIQFQLTVNIVALVINFIAAARSTDVPLNTVQLLWVNLIMDTLGALALATEPPSDEQMKKRPVGRSDPLITLVMWRNLVGQALYQLLVLLFLYFNGIKLLRLEGSAAQKKILLNTIVFNAFVFCQIFNEVNCRKPEKFNVIEGLFSNPLFCGVIFVTTVFQVLIVEFLDNFFTTARLHWKFWLICIGIGSMSLPVGALVKLIPVQKTVNWVRWHGWRWQLITGRSFSNCRIPYQGPLPEDEDIVQVDEHTARVESNV